MPWSKNGFGNLKIVYVESLARVKSLSLTGKLLLPTASLFIIQWPELYTKITGIEIGKDGKVLQNSNDSKQSQLNKRIIFKDDLM